MVTVAILAIVAAAAFAGFRQDEFKNVNKRLIADMEGAIIKARNFALDENTRVRLDISSHEIQIRTLDPATNIWNVLEANAIDGFREGLLLKNDSVCILDIQSGVQTPAQAVNVDPPNACLAGTKELIFEPDGSFTDNTGDIITLENAGVTLWFKDDRIAGDRRYGIIQVFPGGLIRSFAKLDAESIP